MPSPAASSKAIAYYEPAYSEPDVGYAEPAPYYAYPYPYYSGGYSGIYLGYSSHSHYGDYHNHNHDYDHNWNHGRDAIESFVPLVADCTRKTSDQPVSLVELQKVFGSSRMELE